MHPGLRIALQMIRKYGFKSGMSKATRLNVPKPFISEARLMAQTHPDKYLPKWHYMNKRKRAQKKDFEKTIKDYFDNLGR